MRHVIEDELQALIDGEMEGSGAAALRAHLSACSECRRAFDRVNAAGRLFTVAMGRLDTGEPVVWRGAAEGSRALARDDQGRHELRPVARSAPTPLFPGSLRWAAGVTLVLAGAASAALMSGVPLLPGGVASRSEPLVSGGEPARGGAAVAVRALEGSVEVQLDNVAEGSTLELRFADDPDVLVDVSGPGLPRFEARDGWISTDLAGGVASVLVLLPQTLEDGVVRVGERVVIRVEGGVVIPAGAEGEPIPIPGGGDPPLGIP